MPSSTAPIGPRRVSATAAAGTSSPVSGALLESATDRRPAVVSLAGGTTPLRALRSASATTRLRYGFCSGGVGALRWCYSWWCCPPELLSAITGGPAGVCWCPRRRAAGWNYELLLLLSSSGASPTSWIPPSEGFCSGGGGGGAFLLSTTTGAVAGVSSVHVA